MQIECKNQMPGPANSNFTVLQGRVAGALIDALDAHMCHLIPHHKQPLTIIGMGISEPAMAHAETQAQQDPSS